MMHRDHRGSSLMAWGVGANTLPPELHETCWEAKWAQKLPLVRALNEQSTIWQRFINSDRALSSREIPRGHLLVELAHGPAHGAEGGLRGAEGGLRAGPRPGQSVHPG